MNKNDRRQLKSAVEMYCTTVKQALLELREIISKLKLSEEEKLERIPDNLQEGSQVANIEEAIELFEEVSEKLEDMEDMYEEIADTVGIDVSGNRR